MKLFDHTLPVLAFVMVGTRVFVLHAEAHGVVKENSNFARRRCDSFSLANSGCKAPVESAECGIRATDCNRSQSQLRAYPIPFVPEHLKDREAANRVVLEQTVPLNSVGDLVTHLF
ncbi:MULTISPECIES: hypothetical protein [unclassified Caballeronia]|jgi:hypothetical protein|uniref:hypothetical protein n=1 Tax=unclassified Caballeronia TaxID=2646786 RepID=UPI0020282743|nr:MULTISPECIES: hypothetical protein [unclassified Caballeronia]